MSLTLYDRISAYDKACAEITKQLQPRIDLASKEAKQSNKIIYTAFIYQHNSKPFVCSISVNEAVKYCMVYQLLQKKELFEAAAYNPKDRKYYFFSTHFFQRYAQRMSLKHKSQSEILLHFVKLNPVILFDHTNKSGARKAFRALVNAGYIFCNQKNGDHIINFETLISNYTLSDKKREETRSLRKMLRYYSF
jgi:hypothetical protein